jgi:chorismate mutase
METLDELRKSIDNIDNAIIAMFAERFKVTNKVGVFKAANGLPAKDPKREEFQFQRIHELSKLYELDPEFAEDLLQRVINRVVNNHIEIAQKFSIRNP